MQVLALTLTLFQGRMEVGEVFQEVLSGIWDHSLSNIPCAMVLEIMSLRDLKYRGYRPALFENDVLFPETLGSCELIYSKSARWAPTAYTCIFFLCQAVIRNNERAFDGRGTEQAFQSQTWGLAGLPRAASDGWPIGFVINVGKPNRRSVDPKV